MTITYQTLMDADGNPTAALIPWDEFEAIQQRLSEVDSDSKVDTDWSKEIHNRAAEIDNGTVELVDGDDFLNRLRAV